MKRAFAFAEIVIGTALATVATGAIVRLGELFARADAPPSAYAFAMGVVGPLTAIGLLVRRIP